MTFINWNQISRDECALAAAQGNQGAIAAMRLHEQLDKIDKVVLSLETGIQKLSEANVELQKLAEKR